ncbi:MAG: ABC transporter permease, partial [Candidatus Latescibacteria bacterium]|nr:ABC transporter permease [Candidatus Latescibacterota bacterium]
LVVFQFATAIALLIGTSVAYRQIVYIQNKNLGFQKEQMVLIPIFFFNRDLNERSETIKQAFLQHPNVQSATGTWNLPGRENKADLSDIKNPSKNVEARIAMMYTDRDFFDAYNVPLLAGKTFTGDKPTWNEVIFNETAVRLLQLDKNPVGAEVEMWGDRRWKIIGVAKDFHNRSLRDPIGPMAIIRYHRFRHINLKVGMGDFESTLAFFKEQWDHFVPHKQFSFQFMDEYFNSHYQQETRMRQFLGVFSLLAIFISCLGVLGLSAYAAEQRTKEIGIRKVLGASTPQLVSILSKELLILIAIANLIAWPLAYWTMDQWLQNFAYHTKLSLWIFLFAGVLAALIAGSISGYQAVKAARANPVDALRYE